MDLVTESALYELIGHRKESSLSIYMPTNRAGREVKQNAIRYKNLISQVEEKLQNAGMGKPEVQEYLQPLQKVALNDTFWGEQESGLALFYAGDELLAYRLPLKFDERVYLNDRYYIRPLLPLFNENSSFYALALDLAQVRLFAGTRYNVGEIDLIDTPRNLEDALTLEDPEKRLGFHDTASPSAKGKKGMYHQHLPEEDGKKRILRFFHKVDRGVMDAIGEENDPLILVGADHLLSLYEETNSYFELDDVIRFGNPDHLSPGEIHERVWDVVKQRFDQQIKSIINRYYALGENGRAISEPREIVPAAFHGQIETLITRNGAHVWGNFNSEKSHIEVYDEERMESKDLIEIAAAHTLLNGGAVYNLEEDQMPQGVQNVAAIKRYE